MHIKQDNKVMYNSDQFGCDTPW